MQIGHITWKQEEMRIDKGRTALFIIEKHRRRGQKCVLRDIWPKNTNLTAKRHRTALRLRGGDCRGERERLREIIAGKAGVLQRSILSAKQRTTMIIELREKTQITIPQDIVARLGLTEGDKLEITESNGVISIVPVAVYPEGYVEALKKEVTDIKGKIESGEQPVFDSVDEMTEELEAMKNE